MDALYGYGLYVVALLTMGGLYALLTLGLNVQWGFAGLFNAGIAGFFGIGAYTSAFLTTEATHRHMGGFAMPFVVGIVGAMVVSGIVAYLVGKVCLRLRSDYLAIATIGIAEIFRLVVNNELDLTNGARGVSEIPKPFEGLPEPWNHIGFLLVVLATMAVVYWLLEIGRKSPWGRVMTAIRENETAAKAAGKNIENYRMEGFVIGCMIMALGGALMSQYLKFFNPAAIDPLTATFLVWVMLIVGGGANNRGAILGAFLMWTIWSATELVTARLPVFWAPTIGDFELFNLSDLSTRASYVRIFLIGLLLQIFIQRYPQGILRERRPSFSGD